MCLHCACWNVIECAQTPSCTRKSFKTFHSHMQKINLPHVSISSICNWLPSHTSSDYEAMLTKCMLHPVVQRGNQEAWQRKVNIFSTYLCIDLQWPVDLLRLTSAIGLRREKGQGKLEKRDRILVHAGAAKIYCLTAYAKPLLPMYLLLLGSGATWTVPLWAIGGSSPEAHDKAFFHITIKGLAFPEDSFWQCKAPTGLGSKCFGL